MFSCAVQFLVFSLAVTHSYHNQTMQIYPLENSLHSSGRGVRELDQGALVSYVTLSESSSLPKSQLFKYHKCDVSSQSWVRIKRDYSTQHT